MTDVFISIISARRPKSVMKMQDFAPNATWFVALGEAQDYIKEGAVNVIEAGSLIEARNKALEHAFEQNKSCVQLSDDLTKLFIVNDDLSLEQISVEDAVKLMKTICDSTGFKLAGVAPVPNTFYYDPKKPVKTHHFIVGDFIYIQPSKPRFDNDLLLKEDYDFTAQHIHNYGGVARCDFIFAHFKHRTNAGGVVAYRTPEIEQQSIALLKSKWGDAIKDNPRRPNEILFRGQKVKRA